MIWFWGLIFNDCELLTRQQSFLRANLPANDKGDDDKQDEIEHRDANRVSNRNTQLGRGVGMRGQTNDDGYVR